MREQFEMEIAPLHTWKLILNAVSMCVLVKNMIFVYLLYLNGQNCHVPIKWRVFFKSVVGCQKNHLNCVCLRVKECGRVSNKKRNVLGKAQDFQFVENAFTRMWKLTNAKNKCELKCLTEMYFEFLFFLFFFPDVWHN